MEPKIVVGTPGVQLGRAFLACVCPGCGKHFGVDVQEADDKTTVTTSCTCGARLRIQQKG